MFWRQTLIEMRATLAAPVFRLGLAGLTLLLVVFTLVEHAQIAGSRNVFPGGLANDLVSALVFYSWIGSLVSVITAAVITARPFPDHSTPARPVVLLSRLAVVLIFGLFLAVYAVFVSLAVAAFSRLLFFGRVDASWLDWLALGPAVLRIFWVSLPYLALTVLLAGLSHSPLFSVLGTALYTTLVEGWITWQSARFPLLVGYLPGVLARSLLENLTRLNRLAALPQLAGPEPRAALIIAALSLALFGAAMLVLVRQGRAR